MSSRELSLHDQEAQGNSTDSAPGIPEGLRQPLVAVERRRRQLRWCEGGAEAVLTALMLLAVIMTVDRFLHPQIGTRRVLLGCAVLITLAIFWIRGLAPAFRRRNLVTIARAIEDDMPRLQEQLSSAIELGSRVNTGASQWMVARTIALATQRAAQIDAQEIVSAKRAIKLVFVAGLALSGAVAVGIFSEGSSWMRRALIPGSGITRPSKFTMKIRPENALVAHGSSLLIEARVEPDPNDVTLLVQWDDGVSERLRMTRSGNVYQVNFPAITRGFQGKLSADGSDGPDISIIAVEPPRLGSVMLTISPPAYTGLLPRQVPAGDIEVVAGSRVVISVPDASDSLRGAILVRDNGEEIPLAMRENGTLSATFMAEVSETWGLRMVGENGLLVDPTAYWLLTVRPDSPPLVNLHLDAALAGVAAPGEAISCRVQTVDDHGLQSVELIIADKRSIIERRDLLSGRTGAPRQVARSEDVDLSAYALFGGETLYFSVEAIDQGGLKTSGERTSIRIVDAKMAEAERIRKSLDVVLQAVDASLIDLRGFGKNWDNLQRSFRPDDPASQKGELLLLRARLGKICERVLVHGKDMVDLGVNTPLPIGDRMMAAADNLSAWGIIYGGIFSTSPSHFERDGGLEHLRMYQDMNETAIRSLESARGLLAMMAARLEAETLLGAMIDLENKAQAALRVLRVKSAWAGEAWTPGLEMRIYEGTEFASEIDRKLSTLPSHLAAMASGKDRDFSVRWQGDILARSSGKYTVRATVDDGVRVSVAGSDILPQAAWSWQAATSYEGSIEVSAGWHPIIIDFRQGGGEAFLELSWTRDGEKVQPLGPDVLRCREKLDSNDEFLKTMGATSLSAMVDAREVLSQAFAMGAATDATIERLAMETGIERLKAIAVRAQPVAEAMGLALRGEWDHLHPAMQGEHLSVLRQEMQRTRDILAEGTDRMRGYGSALAIERAMIREMKDCVDSLRRIRSSQPESDRAATIRRERSAITWISSALAQRFTILRKTFLDRSGNQNGSIRERQFALSARNSLAWVVDAERESLDNVLERHLLEPKEMATQFDFALKSIEQTMLLVQANIDQADADGAADLSDGFVTDARIIESSRDFINSDFKPPSDFDRLIRHLRITGRRSDADRVRTVFEKWRSGESGKDMEKQLAPMFRRASLTNGHADGALINMDHAVTLLDASEDELSGAELAESLLDDVTDLAREELHAAAIGLQLEALAQVNIDLDRSRAFNDLSEGCTSLAQSLAPTAQAAKEIAQRIRALMEERNQVSDPATDDFLGLLRLIGQAVTDTKQRPAALERVMTAMPSDMNSPEMIDERRQMRDIESIAVALEQERAMALAEERQRADFSLSESMVAESLERLVTALVHPDVEGGKLLSDMVAQAAVSARRRSELARAGSRLPGAESMTLAVEAWASSNFLTDEVGTALAKQALAQNEERRKDMAELALALAEIIEQQRVAAAKLEQFSARRAWQRTRLANAYALSHAHLASDLPSDSTLLADLDRLRNISDAAMRGDVSESAWLRRALQAESAWIERLHAAASDPVTGAPAALTAVAMHANAARMRADALFRMGEGSTAHQDEAHRYEMLAHQYLMRLTNDLPRRADVVLDALKNLGPAPAGKDKDESIQTAAIREVARAVLAAPDSDAAWRYAERTLAIASAFQQGGSGGMNEITDQQMMDLEHMQINEPMDPGIDRAEWMRSQGAAHGDVRATGIEAFSEEYREAIRAYFQHMGASH